MATRKARLVGIDVARALALFGMIATHTFDELNPARTDRSAIFELAGGRSSALFAVLAGVSIALISGRATPVKGALAARRSVQLLVRALLIAAIGLGLGELDSGLAVILTYYGVMFALAIPFLTLSVRWLYTLSVAVMVVVPVASQWLRDGIDAPALTNPTFERLGEPGLLTDLLLTGYYPALPWMAYVLLGMAIGRTDLERVRNLALMAGTGAFAVVVTTQLRTMLLERSDVRAAINADMGVPDGMQSMQQVIATDAESGFLGVSGTSTWWWQLIASPHSASVADLANTAGSALVVIAACLLLFAGLQRLNQTGDVVGRVIAVVMGAGTMTLTLYSLHVVLRTERFWPPDDGPEAFWWHIATVALIGAVFALLRVRGPAEMLVGFLTDQAGRLTPLRGGPEEERTR